MARVPNYRKNYLSLDVGGMMEQDIYEILTPPFLYVNQEGMILEGHWMDVFVFDSSREENVDKVLEMPLSQREEACTFKVYERVLGRDREDQEWYVDLFVSKGEEPYKYRCFRYSYKYCIPYAGNEHLAGR